MKNYQDKETGQIYAFEDDYDPFLSDNRNTPKTLTKNIKTRPTETSVWYDGGWIERTDAPIDYIEPTSSVPSYNPAWMVHLKPYSAIVSDKQPQFQFSLDQINNNSYDGMQLSKVIGILSLEDNLDVLISYDGGIAIPQSEKFSKRVDGITKLNEILCRFLLGGIHTEVLHLHELTVGTLHEKTHLFCYAPSLYNQLRFNWASIADRFQPLMVPRVLHLNDLQKAYMDGREILESIPTFTPFFLLNGYTSLINQNINDALNNLWIVVEQLTEILWKQIYIRHKDNYPRRVQKCHANYKESNYLKHIATKHKLLRLAKVITRQNYKILECARKSRNNLAHRGRQPNREVVITLWEQLPELLESATDYKNIGMREIKIGQEINWNNSHNNNFDEWKELVSLMK
ncbi:hypothetical protein [Acinetobacter sp. YH12102]|uniref:hypothetical protein n=1 Tax=Acinetobacter sp. YH12102 TaxID=2601091 RepID=UPI0015D169A2|nr:hypothetical protein [Acinetobacter sp. YH12102]